MDCAVEEGAAPLDAAYCLGVRADGLVFNLRFRPSPRLFHVSLRGVVILACKPGAFCQRLQPAHAADWEVADRRQFRQLPLYLV